jgi:hypothetical protein
MREYILEVSWYEKQGDNFVGSESMSEEIFSEIKKLLNLHESESITDAYPVSPPLAIFLVQHLKHQIDINKFDYFIEGHIRY